MTTSQRIDKQIADLNEMSATLTGISCGIDALRSERDLLREENQRLQLEVARLRLLTSDSATAIQRLMNPSDSPAEYKTSCSFARVVLAKLEATR